MSRHILTQPDKPIDTQGSTPFTIVIPTRERWDTLYWTLQTCVSQRYDRVEFLVSDNASTDRTREIVASFGDPRIRYINTGRRVSMTANWEFALSHVGDSYVSYLGDDDGLMPDALADLDRLIGQTGAEVVAWKKADYYWPSCWDESLSNSLNLPVDQQLQLVSAEEQLRKVLNFQAVYLVLPMLYNGIIHRRVLRRVQGESPLFFHSMIPDVYSGVATAASIDRYWFSTRPYTVNGVSGHSAGASFLYAFNLPRREGEPAPNVTDPAEAAKRFFFENELTFHPKLERAPSVPIFTTESLLQAQDHVPAARRFSVDMRQMLLHAVSEAAESPSEKYQSIIDAVRKIAQIHSLEAYTEGLIAQYPNLPRDTTPTFGYNLLYKTLRVHTDEFRVHNIYEAAQLCQHLLTLSRGHYHSLGSIARTSVEFARKVARRWLTRKARFLLGRLPMGKTRVS